MQMSSVMVSMLCWGNQVTVTGSGVDTWLRPDQPTSPPWAFVGILGRQSALFCCSCWGEGGCSGE